jgi:hypothetical protein
VWLKGLGWSSLVIDGLLLVVAVSVRCLFYVGVLHSDWEFLSQLSQLTGEFLG